jgi:UDP-N-acetylmuramate dehydrogenase
LRAIAAKTKINNMLQQNVSLQAHHTFGIATQAAWFASFTSIDIAAEYIRYFQQQHSDKPVLILGGGSNLLFTKNYPGLVLKNSIAGIAEVAADDDNVYIKAGAGHNWHQLVMYCVQQGYAGIENLALIPGSCGASPMQNIGAYGVEVKDIFHELEAWHIADGKLVTFTAADCAFGYRESVFKGRFKNQFIITTVTYRLAKKPVFNTSYGAIAQELEAMGVTTLSISAIAQAVISIRNSKLPNPAAIGNAGSFFKNPEITTDLFTQLQAAYPNIVGYPLSNGRVKLAAGWLIEQCGFKGLRRGDAGCHSKQALVLVNYGAATGAQIYALSEEIVQAVIQKFSVTLEREVNIY